MHCCFELNWPWKQDSEPERGWGKLGCPWNLLKEVSVVPTVARNLSHSLICHLEAAPTLKTVKSVVNRSNFNWNAPIPESSQISRYGATTIKLLEKGLNPVEVATIIGNKDTKMLMRYTHFRSEDLVGKLG